jgi:phage terminase small subunit
MPRTGRPPQPTALKLAKGERRPSRVNYDEPVLPVARGTDPPEGLIGAGLREWLRIASMLVEAGVLKDPDLPAMEDYCRRLTDLRALEVELAAQRVVVRQQERAKAPDFALLISGWRAIDSAEKRLIALQSQVNVLRREIGATPSSRSAVKVPARKPEESPRDKAARYMSAIRGGRA